MPSILSVDQLTPNDHSVTINVADIVTGTEILNSNYTAPFVGARTTTLEEKLSRQIDAKDWVVGDGVTDDTVAFQAALNSFGFGGGTLRIGKERIYINGNITIPYNVRVVGSVNPEQITQSVSQGYFSTGSQIRLNPAYSITSQQGAELDGVSIINSQLSLPVVDNASASLVLSQFAGTALTAVDPGVNYRNLLVLGFNYMFYGVATNPVSGRSVFENCKFDCTNGIHKEYAVDIDRFWGCHGWPFLTAHVAGVSTINLSRSGTAFSVKNVADWTQFFGCFSYGYNNGFVFEDVWNCDIMGGGADACGTVGIAVLGASRFCRARDFFINSNNTCVTLNASGGNPDFKTSNCVFNGVTYGVYLTAGSFHSTADTYMGGTGLALTDGAIGASLVQPYLDGVVTPWTGTSNGLKVLSVVAPQYSATQPNTTMPNRSFGTETAVFDRRPAASGVGSILTLGGNTNTGYQGFFRIQPRLVNATAGSEAFDTYLSNYTNGAWADRWVMSADGTLVPATDGGYNIGSGSRRVNTYFAVNGSISTSDETRKKNIAKIEDAVLRAWAKVGYKSYEWKEGDDKIHIGVIAQQVIEAFSSEGLDAMKYGVVSLSEGVYGVNYAEAANLEAALIRSLLEI